MFQLTATSYRYSNMVFTVTKNIDNDNNDIISTSLTIMFQLTAAFFL